jgi:RNA polymerase sigma factor (sigma-70 family)
MPDNTVQADEDLVKRLRTEKGWSQEELANRANVSKKTVENMEASRPTYAGTLAKVARALGVELKQLLAPDRPPVSNGQPGSGDVAQTRSSIEIVIKGDFDHFTEEKESQFLGCIRTLLHITGDIRIVNIREGSVVLTVELTSEQANQLLQAVQAGALAKFGVLDARLVDTPREADADSSVESGLEFGLSWISLLRTGNHAAAQRLWELYYTRLVNLARKKLRRLPRRVADEEDLALSAFESFFQAVQEGRYPQLREKDIWPLLVLITARHVLEVRQSTGQQKRGHRPDPSDSTILNRAWSDMEMDLEQIVGHEPSPAFAAQLAEECQRLLERLGKDDLRSVALWKMEGYTNAEIAEKLHCAPGTVERKLRVIRRIWQRR